MTPIPDAVDGVDPQQAADHAGGIPMTTCASIKFDH